MSVNKISQKVFNQSILFLVCLFPLTHGGNHSIFRKIAPGQGWVRGVRKFGLMIRDRRKYPKWPNNSPTGLITLLCILNACRVTTAWTLDVIGGYLLAAGFSAVPVVFLVTLHISVSVCLWTRYLQKYSTN